jgi:hypothetical protein|nr:MAG TPA: hypothetical protein [Caudoviricetes sp.]DAK36184.1 MAG TPA: hypothetical protein [Caudoviricetes sp.]DAS96638.1 MAG TPA: hypothetical protein [Caudoviricetes sp.]
MITILEVLKGINAYPIPQRTIGEIAIKRSLNLDADLTSDIAVSKGFLLAKADLYMWLSFAPDVSQGGQSYSFSEDQRTSFRNLAKAIYSDFGETSGAVKTKFGYKGDTL